MKITRFSLYHALSLSCVLLFSVAPSLHAQHKQGILSLSESEIHEVLNSAEASYVYLGKEISNIAHVIANISQLDSDPDSLTHALKKHIDQGFAIGLYDAVLETVNHAYQTLRQKHTTVTQDQMKSLKKELNTIIKQLIKGDLTITINTIKDAVQQEDSETEQLPQEADSTIKKPHTDVAKDNLKVEGNLTVEHHAHIKGKLKVKKTANFKHNIKIAKNIYIHNSRDHKVGNVYKHEHRFIHNFGRNNTFVGVDAGNFKMKGDDNSGFGVRALQDNTTGQNNTAIGAHTLTFNTIGSLNVAVGSRALASNLAGQDNVAVGTDTLRANQVGNGNTAVGNKALEMNTGKNNSAFGREALLSSTSGDGNTSIGSFSMQSNRTGQYNTAVGEQAQFSITSGTQNVSIGSRSLYSNRTGINNVAIGGHALYSNQVNGNVAVGNRALFANITGDSNVAVGRNTLITNTTGDSNTALGSYALENNMTGRLNVALGKEALRNVTTGSTNIAVGLRAGINLTTGNNNIYIDNDGISNEHNGIRIGAIGKQNKCFIQGIYQNPFNSAQADVQVEVGTGKLGIFTSSAQFKDNIEDLPRISAKGIYALHPVNFTYKHDASQKRQIGLLAEEVEKIYPELVVYDTEGKPFSICYKLLSVLLLSEIQEMNGTMKSLLEKNDQHEALINELVAQIKILKQANA